MKSTTKKNEKKFEEPTDSYDLVNLLIYFVPLGLGTISFIGITICIMVFCMKPTKSKLTRKRQTVKE